MTLNMVWCVVILSDLLSIRPGTSKSRPDLVYKVLTLHSKLMSEGREVVFVWVLSHSGIEGNEWADRLAKHALGKDCVDLSVGAICGFWLFLPVCLFC